MASLELRPEQNGRQFAVDIFKYISREKIIVRISQEFVPDGPTVWQLAGIDLDNDVSPVRWQAITWLTWFNFDPSMDK